MLAAFCDCLTVFSHIGLFPARDRVHKFVQEEQRPDENAVEAGRARAVDRAELPLPLGSSS